MEEVKDLHKMLSKDIRHKYMEKHPVFVNSKTYYS